MAIARMVSVKMNLRKGEMYYGYFSSGKINGVGLISKEVSYFLFSEFKNNIPNSYVFELNRNITFTGTAINGKINGNGFYFKTDDKVTKGGFFSGNNILIEHPFTKNIRISELLC